MAHVEAFITFIVVVTFSGNCQFDLLAHFFGCRFILIRHEARSSHRAYIVDAAHEGVIASLSRGRARKRACTHSWQITLYMHVAAGT
jgi:hypothetical protein